MLKEQQTDPGEFKNVIDSYRSVTYNFTLACISANQLRNPESYRNNKKLDFVIAQSAGKSAKAMNPDNAGDSQALVETFNKESPGSYDLFLDNLEIDTLMTPTEETGPALGTKVRFDVFEPYSVNGFIEALHVAGVAAGWGGYITATFLLKVDFWGYPDSETSPSNIAKKLPADKYIPIKITKVDIEVTEQGTRYKVAGIPVNEQAFGNPLRLSSARQMTGSNVKEVLKDLETGLNEGAKDNAENERGNEGSKLRHRYKILFPDTPDANESFDLSDSANNKIGKADINKTLKENNVYQFISLKEKENSPNGTDQNKKYDPQKSVVQFAANSDILDIITAVVRDSSYLEDTLKKIKEEAKSDDGMVEYFQVIVNSIPLKKDEVNNIQLYEFQYLVIPYKVHSSKLPDQQKNKFNPKRLKKLVKRKYDYLYGGRNAEILNFKLNFNNLYFQAANPNMGNKPINEHSNTPAPSDNVELTKPVESTDNQSSAETRRLSRQGSVGAGAGRGSAEDPRRLDRNGTPPSQTTPEASSQEDRAAPPRTTPYWELAMAAHRAILESVNLVTGTLEILGDPYFLCTSGMGNYLPKIKNEAVTVDGEANYNSVPVVVELNFRNPIDIGANGFLKFRELAPFSGLYQVIKCHSTFKDGIFKQELKLMRYNGQLEDTNQSEIISQDYKSVPKSSEALEADTAPATVQKAGVKPNEATLASMIQKGSPLTGLPGNLNKFASDGNFIPGLSDYLSGETAGGTTEAAKASAGVLGNALGKVVDFAKTGGSLLAQASGLASGLVPSAGDLVNKASGALGQGVNLINQTAGLGLSVGNNLNGLDPLSAGVRLGSDVLSGVANVGKGLTSPLGDAKDKVSNLFSINGSSLGLDQKSAVINDAISKGISPDLALRSAGSFGLNLPKVGELNPGAMMSKLGLDPGKITGLSGITTDLSSQLKTVLAEVPDDVDIGEAKEQGIVLANLNKQNIKNLPAIAPDIAAPEIEISKTDVIADVKSGLANAEILNQYGLTSALGELKSNIPGSLSNLGNLKSLTSNPLSSVGNALSNAIPGVSDFSKSITAQLGSKTGASPLDKIMADVNKIGQG